MFATLTLATFNLKKTFTRNSCQQYMEVYDHQYFSEVKCFREKLSVYE